MKNKIIISSLLVSCCLFQLPVFATDLNTIQNNEIPISGGNITLYFDSDGGSDCSPLTIGIGINPDTVYELPTPTKDGYKFEGWYNAENEKIDGSYFSVTSAFDTVENGAVSIVTAKWSQMIINEAPIQPVGGSATLYFDTQGHDIISPLKIGVGINPNTVYELPIPIAIDMKFIGWFTEDGKQIDGSYPSITSAFDTLLTGSEATVYAKWEDLTPLNAASSISIEKIEGSEEYYEIVNAVYNYTDGSKMEKIVKTKKIEDFVITEETELTFYNVDGTITKKWLALDNGYHEYNQAKAKNSLDIEIKDIDGNPVKDIKVKALIGDTTYEFTTDENGKIYYEFDKSLKCSTELLLSNEYQLIDIPMKRVLGCMYSVIYKEEYIIAQEKLLAPPIMYEEPTTEEIVQNDETIIEDTKIENEIKIQPIENKDVEIDSDEPEILTEVPQTNDNQNIALECCLSLFALCGIGLLSAKNKKD